MRIMPYAASRFVGRKILVAKKNSPHIFFGLGLVGVVGGAVLACRSTLKLEETVDDIKKDFANRTTTEAVDERAFALETGQICVKSAIRVGKLYGPAVVVGGLGVASLSGAHVQLSRRNAALTATLAAVHKLFEEYRVRVRKELGETLEQDIYRGLDSDVAGSQYQFEVVNACGGYGFSVYARVFDETCPDYTRDAEHNRFWIACQQKWANDKLNSRGHVFLNEVYDSLGFDRTKMGAVVGWVRRGDGDGYIDFNLDVGGNRFINGQEASVWLDFNVDGVIYDLIEE